jgi:hypothetical protein
MMREINSLILLSGESIELVTIFEAVLLLARANAGFPLLTPGAVSSALTNLIPVIVDYNESEGIV